MTDEDLQPRTRKRQILWLVLATVILLLAGLLVPPFISVSRYKNGITALMSRSLGRPVHLSSVTLRLLPWPGFLLDNLTVDADPAFGTEPVLHANTVKASIRLLSLWRGKLEIDSISVDEASLNLVRTAQGTWNLDPLFRTAAAHVRPGGSTASQEKPVRLPYLEATNSRINFKDGLEKLPYSLVNADLSFWQENPGEWRIRLRGQPARTDVVLDLADTGEVRLEASLHNAAELRQMPILLNMQWQDAQLGQLSRLLFGVDPGWRGDLKGQLHLEGTPDAAKVTTRLSATGVHRAEFAPADPLDFDASCGFQYNYSTRTVDKLACDSPLGDGHLHVEGSLPGNTPPKLTLKVDKIAMQAGLDLLRTIRSGVSDDLEAKGSVTGTLNYDPTAVPVAAKAKVRTARHAAAKAPTTAPFTGSLKVTGFALSGGPLEQALTFPDFEMVPVTGDVSQPVALSASDEIAAGGPSPLSVAFRVSHAGYELSLQGPASFKHLREFAQLAGVENKVGLDQFSGEGAVLNISAEGPWLPSEENLVPAARLQQTESPGTKLPSLPPAGPFTGSLTLRKATWKSPVLANPVSIDTATLQLGAGVPHWQSNFVFGPVKGTAELTIPVHCEQVAPCIPEANLAFEELNAGVLQTALLGASDKKTLLSALISQFTSSAPPAWPLVNVNVDANTVVLGTVKLQKAKFRLAIRATSADIESFDAKLFDGDVHLTGIVTDSQSPAYELSGGISKANAKLLCEFLNLRCSGRPVDVSGKVNLSGFAAKDLAASATGSLQLEWAAGAVRGWTTASGSAARAQAIPPSLANFSRWTADLSLRKSQITFENSQATRGRKSVPVPVSIVFGEPPKVTFPSEEQLKRK
ncbi:MAG TPA: AsmA family protein [Terracidiphilus sp.]|nr:AsmA family protein [Terracidiphilus sp.]